MERVAIMVVDGGLPPAEAERDAWAGHPAPGATGAIRRQGARRPMCCGLGLDSQATLG